MIINIIDGQFVQEDTKNTSPTEIISNNNDCPKYNHNHHKLLILIFLISKYNHIRLTFETIQYDFISFGPKNVQYHNAIKNMNLSHDYNENLILSLDKNF